MIGRFDLRRVFADFATAAGEAKGEDALSVSSLYLRSSHRDGKVILRLGTQAGKWSNAVSNPAGQGRLNQELPKVAPTLLPTTIVPNPLAGGGGLRKGSGDSSTDRVLFVPAGVKESTSPPPSPLQPDRHSRVASVLTRSTMQL